MPPNDQPLQVQQDNIAPVPNTGAGIRTILVTVMVNNVPTQVAMQCIAVADEDGHTIDFSNDGVKFVLYQLLQEQRITNTMLSLLSGVPYSPTDDPVADIPNCAVG